MDPLQLCIKKDLTVEDVIGYALFEYHKEGILFILSFFDIEARKPFIPRDMRDIVIWNLRMVEDDGEVDEDFPGKYLYHWIS